MARPTTVTCIQTLVTQPCFQHQRRSDAPTRARPRPTAIPIPSSSASRIKAEVSLPPCSPPTARAIKNSSMGTQIPSFSPLSTFRPSRIRDGTALLVITALPSAASVAASMVARIAASYNDKLSNISTARPNPSAITPGRPISNIRDGIRNWRFRIDRSAFAASMNRIKARVKSASVRKSELVASPSNQPIPNGPIRNPAMTNTMGPEIADRSTRPATML